MSVRAVAVHLQTRIGLDPHSLGLKALSNIVAERMRTLGMTDPLRYALRLADSAEESAALIDAVVVPETWFFRGGKVFSYLAEQIQLRTASASSQPFRVLSAPCSSGEEPYSMVIALLEAGVARARWVVEGIDVSSRSLDRARRGLYRDLAFRESPPELKCKYFRQNDINSELDTSLRGLVRFHQGNLLDSELLAGEAAYDLIFCRNLLIYLHEEARARVLANLDRLLAPRGILCMGHAEPWNLLEGRFRATGSHSFFLFERVPSPGQTRQPPEKKINEVPATPVRIGRPGKQKPRRVHQETGTTVAPAPAPRLDQLAQARREADAGSLDKALQTCRAHLSVALPSADAYSLLGVIHQARRERAEAIDCFRKALYIDSQHEEALLHLLLLYQESGDKAAADLLRRRLDRKANGGKT